jgi:hypothetical protein
VSACAQDLEQKNVKNLFKETLKITYLVDLFFKALFKHLISFVKNDSFER